MDKPPDPTAPPEEVYQAFFDDLVKEGTKPSTISTSTTASSGSGKGFNDNGQDAEWAMATLRSHE